MCRSGSGIRTTYWVAMSYQTAVLAYDPEVFDEVGIGWRGIAA